MKKEKNRGSTTVEMCFVMPIVLLVCAFCIGLFVNSFRILELWGASYIKLASYNAVEFSKAEIEKNIQESFGDLYDVDVISVSADGGVIKFKLNRENYEKDGAYIYNCEELGFNREYDTCTSRLRRWQLYGDILQK